MSCQSCYIVASTVWEAEEIEYVLSKMCEVSVGLLVLLISSSGSSESHQDDMRCISTKLIGRDTWNG